MINGKYNDVLFRHDSQSKVDHGWKSNRIVSGSDVLVASLMKGEPGISGILYLAIGTGEARWDGMNLTAGSSAVQLRNEVLRHPIQPSEMAFIDQLDQPSSTPTSRLEVIVDLVGPEIVNESVLSLREFGLFGGEASEELNSGRLINYVIHPRIDLTSNATLRRQLRISFSSSVTTSEDETQFPIQIAPQWIRELPLSNIDGVGPVYSARLLSVSITTIEELSSVESANLEINIPPMKLVEFKAKAQLALQTMKELQVVSGLQSSSLKDLMSTSVAQLALQSAESQGTIQKLTEQLGHLQMAMDDSFLENKTISDLITGFVSN